MNFVTLFIEGIDPGMMNIILLAGFVIVFYLFFIRPKQQEAKEGKSFLENMQKGDKIVTAGGIHGRIAKMDETTLLVEVDTNTKIRIEKTGISIELTKQLTAPKKEE
ncbi:MAG: preprotein translocase subunit YajC [Chitinophagales bacterium]